MFNKRLNCVVAAVLLAGLGTPRRCPAQEKPEAQGKPSVVADSGSHTVVLPISADKMFFFPKGTQYWTSAAADIARLEEDLPTLAKVAPAPRFRKGVPPRSILAYYRQYIGIIENGRRCIYINAFGGPYGTEFADWKSHAVRVRDGGDYFYHATYDVKTRKFEKFACNGYA